MKTDNLIAALAADLPTRPTSPRKALGLAVIVSAPIAFGLLVYALGFRGDIDSAIQTMRFDFKLGLFLALSAAALWLTARLARPGAGAGSAKTAIACVAGTLAIAIVLELLTVPSSEWMSHLTGNMALQCVTYIPLMAAGPLVAILLAMRTGAPDNAMAAGAAGGLLAGSIAAVFYAPHCPNDSPFYIATWYLIGIAAVVVVGALAGRQVLRW